jgi:hypothetical protein
MLFKNPVMIPVKIPLMNPFDGPREDPFDETFDNTLIDPGCWLLKKKTRVNLTGEVAE